MPTRFSESVAQAVERLKDPANAAEDAKKTREIRYQAAVRCKEIQDAQAVAALNMQGYRYKG